MRTQRARCKLGRDTDCCGSLPAHSPTPPPRNGHRALGSHVRHIARNGEPRRSYSARYEAQPVRPPSHASSPGVGGRAASSPSTRPPPSENVNNFFIGRVRGRTDLALARGLAYEQTVQNSLRSIHFRCPSSGRFAGTIQDLTKDFTTLTTLKIGGDKKRETTWFGYLIH